MKAVVAQQKGGPEVVELVEIPKPTAGAKPAAAAGPPCPWADALVNQTNVALDRTWVRESWKRQGVGRACRGGWEASEGEILLVRPGPGSPDPARPAAKAEQAVCGRGRHVAGRREREDVDRGGVRCGARRRVRDGSVGKETPRAGGADDLDPLAA